MEKVAIIVAGGSGKRMGSDLPKQFLLLSDKPVLYYTIQAFLSAYEDMQIILVLAEDYWDTGRKIIESYFRSEKIKIATGGATRFESVKSGLAHVKNEAIIFVHDAVRCTISEALIRRCFEMALATGSAIPVVKSSDSIRRISEEGASEAMNREDILMVQTPQVFQSNILLPAFTVDYNERFTDEASVVEASGIKISLVEGDRENIKITHPIDLKIAEHIITNKYNR